jgi:hypothetical protein
MYLNTSVRTAEIINWFCFTNMPAEKKLLGCFRGNRLLGFMILMVDRDARADCTYCADLWFDPQENEEEIVAALVDRAAIWSRNQGFDYAVFPHFHRKLGECYTRLGLLSRPAWKGMEYFLAPGKVLGSMTLENTYLAGWQGEVGL